MSVYRCLECGHGRYLDAWARTVVHGPLAADGTLAWYADSGDEEVFVDSIQCSAHPSFTLEKKVGARFFGWVPCQRCSGSGRVQEGPRWSSVERPCRDCGGEGGAWSAPSPGRARAAADL